MTNNIKKNINSIDFRLKELFDKVSITEKSQNNSFYFEIIAESVIDKKLIQVNAKISKNDLINNSINWSYLSNTNDKNSYLVERVSNIDGIDKDIFDVVKSKKLSREYIDSIKEIEASINESNTTIGTNDLQNNINNILLYHDVASLGSFEKVLSLNENQNIFIKTPYKLFLKIDKPIKESTQFEIEQKILKLESVDYVFFDDTRIEISITE